MRNPPRTASPLQNPPRKRRDNALRAEWRAAKRQFADPSFKRIAGVDSGRVAHRFALG